MSRYRIEIDDLAGPQIHDLLSEHLAAMHATSPPQSVHALGVEGLRAPDVTFWSAWNGEHLAGCGALRELDAEHGEVKSMRTATTYLRRGVAAAMLAHLVEVARGRGYRRLSLETGSGEPFDPAHALYASFGFVPTGPFAAYTDDPFSRFLTLEL